MPNKKTPQTGATANPSGAQSISQQLARLQDKQAVLQLDNKSAKELLDSLTHGSDICIQGSFKDNSTADSFFRDLGEHYPDGMAGLRWECASIRFYQQTMLANLTRQLCKGLRVERLGLHFTENDLMSQHEYFADLKALHVQALRLAEVPPFFAVATIYGLLRNPHLRNLDLTLCASVNLPSLDAIRQIMENNFVLENISIDCADGTQTPELQALLQEVHVRTNVNKLMSQAIAQKAKYDAMPEDNLTDEEVAQAEKDIAAFDDYFKKAIHLSEKTDSSTSMVRTSQIRLHYALHFPEGLPIDPKPDLLNVINHMKPKEINFDLLFGVIAKAPVEDSLWLLTEFTPEQLPREQALLAPLRDKLISNPELTRQQTCTSLALMFSLEPNPLGDNSPFLPLFAQYMGMKTLPAGVTLAALQAEPHKARFEQCLNAVRAEVDRLKLPTHSTHFVATKDNIDGLSYDLTDNPTVTSLEVHQNIRLPLEPLRELFQVDESRGKPKNTHISSLVLQRIQVRRVGKEALGRFCQDTLAENLSLKSFRLESARGLTLNVSDVLRMLERNQTLETVDIPNSSFDLVDSPIQGLANNNTLQTLILRGSSFYASAEAIDAGEQAAQSSLWHLAAGLAANTCLRHLDLRDYNNEGYQLAFVNTLSSSMMRILGEGVIQNQGLRELLLPGLTADGAVSHLIKMLQQNPRLERLQVQRMPSLSDEEMIELANALGDHPNLQHLELEFVSKEDVAPSAGTLDYFFHKLASMESLKRVSIACSFSFYKPYVVTAQVQESVKKLMGKRAGLVSVAGGYTDSPPIIHVEGQQAEEASKAEQLQADDGPPSITPRKP